MRFQHLILGVVAFFLPAAAPAFGHAGFIVPVLDESETTGQVIFEASFSDSFPDPEIGLVSSQWQVIDPTGQTFGFDRVVERPSRTILQTSLDAPGTYRLTSGERLGRIGEVAKLDGRYVRLGRDGLAKDTLPEEAEILTSQTATVSDIYVSKGTSSDAVLANRIGRLAIIPDTNPTDHTSGAVFSFHVAFDDAPHANAMVTLFAPGGSRDEADPSTQLETNMAGESGFTPTRSGPHLLMVRHLAPAPDGADTDIRSYTTVLTVMIE